MFVDICIPKDNEEKFIQIADKLGTKGLVFLYDKKEKDLEELQKTTNLKLFSGLIVNKNPGKVNTLYFAKGERKNIENKNIKFLFGFESIEEKDSLHFRRSGINQVHAKLMKDKEKVLVLDMEKILETKSEMLIGRMRQNLVIAKKYKLELVVASFATKPFNLKSSKDYEALIRTLGYEEQAKKATETLSQYILS